MVGYFFTVFSTNQATPLDNGKPIQMPASERDDLLPKDRLWVSTGTLENQTGNSSNGSGKKHMLFPFHEVGIKREDYGWERFRRIKYL